MKEIFTAFGMFVVFLNIIKNC